MALPTPAVDDSAWGYCIHMRRIYRSDGQAMTHGDAHMRTSRHLIWIISYRISDYRLKRQDDVEFDQIDQLLKPAGRCSSCARVQEASAQLPGTARTIALERGAAGLLVTAAAVVTGQNDVLSADMRIVLGMSVTRLCLTCMAHGVDRGWWCRFGVWAPVDTRPPVTAPTLCTPT